MKRISDNSRKHQKVYRELSNIKNSKSHGQLIETHGTILIKYHELLFELKSDWIVYRSKLHLNIMSHSGKFQWYGRRDVPLGKPVMYHVTLREELRQAFHSD